MSDGPAPASAPGGAARDRVDVWTVALDLDPRERAAALGVLAPDERAWGARLRQDADRWCAARAALRRVLGDALGMAPGEVPLVSGSGIKPRLTPATPALRFNHSRSGAFALIAVRLGHEVGVDLERLRDDVDFDAVAREMLAPTEREAIAGVAPAARAGGFFRAWVRHEALAKATGRGIVAPPDPGALRRFAIRDLAAPPGHVAAVASEGEDWSVALRTLPDQ